MHLNRSEWVSTGPNISENFKYLGGFSQVDDSSVGDVEIENRINHIYSTVTVDIDHVITFTPSITPTSPSPSTSITLDPSITTFNTTSNTSPTSSTNITLLTSTGTTAMNTRTAEDEEKVFLKF